MKTCEDPMILSQESIVGVRINNPRGSECDIQLSGSTFHVVEAWDSFLFLPKNSPKKQKPNNIKSEELDIHNWSCGETPLAHWKTTSPSSFTSQVPNDPPQTLSYSCRLAHAGLGYFDPHCFACGNGWNYSPHKKWMVKEYLQNVQEYVKCKTRFYVAIIFWGFFPGVPRYSQRMAYEQQTMTSGSTKLPPLGPGAAKAKPPPALSPQTLAFNSWIYRNMCIYILYESYI